MIEVIPGKYPHIAWIDLEHDGIAVEIAVMKNDDSGLYFIRLDQLDRIDKQRLFKVINNRNANLYELWDLMSNCTIGNGSNALSYFHQLVKCYTPQGKIIKPTEGRRGVGENYRKFPVKEEVPAVLEEVVVPEEVTRTPAPAPTPAPVVKTRRKPVPRKIPPHKRVAAKKK